MSERASTCVYMVLRDGPGYGFSMLDPDEHYCFLTKKEAEAFADAQRNPGECEVIALQLMAYQPAVVTPAVMTPTCF